MFYQHKKNYGIYNIKCLKNALIYFNGVKFILQH